MQLLLGCGLFAKHFGSVPLPGINTNGKILHFTFKVEKYICPDYEQHSCLNTCSTTNLTLYSLLIMV